jgi:hypothetical protein
MFGIGKNKERQRYYLLPGQGGRSARRKHLRILLWSLVAGIFASAILAGILYLIAQPL